MFLVCHQIKGDWIKPGAAVIDVGHIVSAAAEQDVMVCTHMQLPQQNPRSFGANHLPVLTDYRVTCSVCPFLGCSQINGNGDLIKPGAVVIHDADTDSVDDDPAELVGDVDFAEVSKVAGFLTPVPGGAGPMMVAMLLKNTVDAAKQGQGICKDAKSLKLCWCNVLLLFPILVVSTWPRITTVAILMSWTPG